MTTRYNFYNQEYMPTNYQKLLEDAHLHRKMYEKSKEIFRAHFVPGYFVDAYRIISILYLLDLFE